MDAKLGKYKNHHARLHVPWDHQHEMLIQAVSPCMFRVQILPFQPVENELSAVQEQMQTMDQNVRISIEQHDSSIYIYAEHAMLQVKINEGKIQLYTPDRHLQHSVLLYGNNETKGYVLEHCLQEQELLYGTGESKANGLELNGQKFDISNSWNETKRPFIISSGGWGALYAASGSYQFDIGAADSRKAIVAMQTHAVDLYLISGNDFSHLLRTLHELIGKPELLPLRAYGLSYACHSSRHAQEVIQDAINFREQRIPCDYIVLRDDLVSKLADDDVRFDHMNELQPMSFMDTLRRHEFEISVQRKPSKQWNQPVEERSFIIQEIDDDSPVHRLKSAALWIKQQQVESMMATVFRHGLHGQINTAIQMDLSSRESIHASFLQAWTHVIDWHPAILDPSMQQLFRVYAKLRYRLLPYIYSTAHAAIRTGMPITRPMALMFPNDPQCRSLLTQYMFGDFLLVGVFTNRVYLPEGEWIDYWNGQCFHGGQWVDCHLPEEAGGPLYLRAGAILPCWPDMDYIGTALPNAIWLHIYPQKNHSSQFLLAEDDGISQRYKEGQISATKLQCSVSEDGTMTIRIARRTGTCCEMPAARSFHVIIHHVMKPKQIRLQGNELAEQSPRHRSSSVQGWSYDPSNQTAHLYIHEAELTSDMLIELFHVDANDNQMNREDGRDVPLEHDGKKQDDESARRHLADLCEALQKRNPDHLEHALESWWRQIIHRSAMPRHWRLKIMEGAMIAVRFVERHGGKIEQLFGDDLNMLYQLSGIRTPEQGYHLLVRLFKRSLQLDSKPAKPPMHPIVRQAILLIELSQDMTITLQEASKKLNVSSAYFSRLFSKETGQSFTDYVLHARMERAKELLQKGFKVHETAARTGFKDAAHFSRTFKKHWGKTPAQFKQNSKQ